MTASGPSRGAGEPPARPLEGRVALVTGGSRGIGFATARGLGRAGARVVLAARDAEALEVAAARLAAEGIPATPVATDVTDPAAVDRLVEGIEQASASVDVLVANAGGFATKKPLTDITTEEWSSCFAVNADGVFFSCRAVLPGMLAASSGRIVVVSSRAAVGGGVLGLGGTRNVPYAAAKAATHGLVQALALEVGGTGVTVNAVAPGPIATETFRLRRGAEGVAALERTIPVGRAGDPDDIAHAVTYLATDPGFVTGQVVHVNGGTWIG